MAQKLDTISRFSPGNCAPELLESILVGRDDVIDRLEKSVLDSIETAAGHHWLLIGPRGVGKTHLLAVLYNRINANPEIRSRVAIAYMKEEERGVATFLDWLVRILRAFHRWQEVPAMGDDSVDLSEGLESLKDLPLGQAQTAAERLLLRFVGERRLLLISENLGEIFDETKGMGREGQQRFRDLVQQHPIWTIIASSQALFKDIQVRDAPFYGFFKIQHLKTFDLSEAATMLQKLAGLQGKNKLLAFFRTAVGKGRLKAIHQLTGGNPRLLVIFYQLIERDSIENFASPFLEMVDSLTGYYQEQMQALPALQQKIVAFLCERRVATTVKEIARSCFTTHQTASKQLKRLADKNYVVATTVGRQSFYELREPLFRICFEVQANFSYPIRQFVEFLGDFYSMEELRRQHSDVNLSRPDKTDKEKPENELADSDQSYISEPRSVYDSTRSALALVDPGDLDAVMQRLEIPAREGQGPISSDDLPIYISIISEQLLRQVAVAELLDLLTRQQIAVRSPLFIKGLNRALMELLTRHEEIPLDRLMALRDQVIPQLSRTEGLVVACRLFSAGVDYLETQDLRVLLGLPREERQIFEEILKPAGATKPAR